MFGNRLTFLRKSKKLSQYGLAKLLNLTRGQIANYEQGKRNPDYDILKLFADFFNVTTDYLLDHSNDSRPQSKQNVLSLHNRKSIEGTAEEIELLEDVRSLKEHERYLVKNTIKLLVQSEKEQSAAAE